MHSKGNISCRATRTSVVPCITASLWVFLFPSRGPSGAGRHAGAVGGIWAPGGISTDVESLFVATGNTLGAETWSDGEAVLRLAPDLHRSYDKKDFFAPSDWQALDALDADLGGTNPLPLDIPTQNGNQALILALGKDGKAYLLDRHNLGGIGGSLAVVALPSDTPLTNASRQ